MSTNNSEEKVNVCLSDTSDPYEVIRHIFRNKTMYENVINSIALARNAKLRGGSYCLYFKNPFNNTSITISGERILFIYTKCCVNWCNDIEKVAGLILLNSEFFRSVLLSYTEALQARSQSKEYCKTFNIPRCLFPNVKSTNMNGKTILRLMDC